MVQVPQQQLLQEVQLASLISGRSEDVIRVPGVNSREIVSDYYCDHMVRPKTKDGRSKDVRGLRYDNRLSVILAI